MLSHIVTAAKGLFSAQQIAEDDPNSTHQDQSQATSGDPKIMVTSTRGTRYGHNNVDELSDKSSNIVVSLPGSGKRKSKTTPPSDAGSQVKKRKTAPEDSTENVMTNGTPGTWQREKMVIRGKTNGLNGTATAIDELASDSKSPSGVTAKSTHMRFGSEEYIPAANGEVDAVWETKQEEAVEDDESSDDDEAPEALDNSTQLANMKAALQNEEQAKQRQERLKREKRKELDQRLKSQAITKKSKDLSNGSGRQARIPEQDDMMSESTATLQDNSFKESKLPALLPDEILNAEPAARLPTPVSETDHSKPRISQKPKFLDEEQRLPKDVRRGGTTFRVLEGASGKAGTLAPRVSKSGKNVRENWLSGNRNRNGGVHTSGLRRTGGGSSGFLRK